MFLARLDDLGGYVNSLEKRSLEWCFFRALVSMHRGRLEEAESVISPAAQAFASSF